MAGLALPVAVYPTARSDVGKMTSVTAVAAPTDDNRQAGGPIDRLDRVEHMLGFVEATAHADRDVVMVELSQAVRLIADEVRELRLAYLDTPTILRRRL